MFEVASKLPLSRTFPEVGVGEEVVVVVCETDFGATQTRGSARKLFTQPSLAFCTRNLVGTMFRKLALLFLALSISELWTEFIPSLLHWQSGPVVIIGCGAL
jgi:hypothetical protein